MQQERRIRNLRLVRIVRSIGVYARPGLLTPLAEREVKRANRDLLQHVSKMDNMQKIDHLTKRSSELLADMRRLDKENQKNKRRGDTLQKERDGSRSELSKTVGLKEKLEKLCRELQRDNNKMKVRR